MNEIEYIQCNLPTAKDLVKIFVQGYEFSGEVKIFSVCELGFEKVASWSEVLNAIEQLSNYRIMTSFEALVACRKIGHLLDYYYQGTDTMAIAAMHPIQAHDMDRKWGMFVLAYRKEEYAVTRDVIGIQRMAMPVPLLADGQIPDGTVGPHILVACIKK